LGATYLDEEGELHPVVMGSYGIGSGRLLACVAEKHNDEHGLIMPMTVAPYQVYLMFVPGKKVDTEAVAEDLYEQLQLAGVEVLYDDRDERAGVKFNDADLMGIPLRLVVGERSLQEGGLELRRRDGKGDWVVPVNEAVVTVRELVDEMLNEIEALVVPMPYPED
jgi:prolyl-tRNA synthetase